MKTGTLPLLSNLLITSILLATEAVAAIWQPPVTSTWQIVLQSPLNMTSITKMTPDVAIYDIDLFTNTANGTDKDRVIGKLHALGKKVICYFSAGTYEPYRPDSGDFDQGDIGATLPQWQDERWLNVRSEKVRGIMSKRIQLAADMGCDGIDPDNMDVYNNENGGGFQPPLTANDSIAYVQFLASQASSQNLAMGLKNAIEIIPSVVSTLQFAVNEECSAHEGDCDGLTPFIQQGKPVFHIEYPDAPGGGTDEGFSVEARSAGCKASGVEGLSTLLAEYSLNGWCQFCDGSVWRTNTEAINGTSTYHPPPSSESGSTSPSPSSSPTSTSITSGSTSPTNNAVSNMAIGMVYYLVNFAFSAIICQML